VLLYLLVFKLALQREAEQMANLFRHRVLQLVFLHRILLVPPDLSRAATFCPGPISPSGCPVHPHHFSFKKAHPSDASAAMSVGAATDQRQQQDPLSDEDAECNVSPPWTITVRTMTGAAIAVPCHAAALTTVANIKRALSAHNRHWAPERQCLMLCLAADAHVSDGESNAAILPPASPITPSTLPASERGSEASCALASIASTDNFNINATMTSDGQPTMYSPPLADDCTLADCGLADGARLELLVRDMVWSDAEAAFLAEARVHMRGNNYR
jgi:hypothetical protein